MKLVDVRSPEVRESSARLELGEGMAVVWTSDGVFFEHECRVLPDDIRLLCAPSFHAEHVVNAGVMELATVKPSVLCPDCGTHGFITDGVWKGC